MDQSKYWNHNSAYYPWIKQNLNDCNYVLDVGCGNGALINFLDDGIKRLNGIDIDKKSIDFAATSYSGRNVRFTEGDFLQASDEEKYDGIVFVASIHHMDMMTAIQRAKSMLNPNRVLLIVGLAKPSTIYDYLVEVLRIVPSRIISKIKQMKSSEELDISVSYTIPALNEVRYVIDELLPGAEFRQALHFRYQLKWTNKDN